ncbi:MAG: hypothetical protein O7C56_06905 [Rickettsia endosymbiont of Ixodes persulcatus]|nr:hypothetical protein [Rickettsia endosymbiont of Ixodes persulcatus]
MCIKKKKFRAPRSEGGARQPRLFCKTAEKKNNSTGRKKKKIFVDIKNAQERTKDVVPPLCPLKF